MLLCANGGAQRGRHLCSIIAPRNRAGQNLPQGVGPKVGRHLLQLALHPGLRLVLHEHPGAQQNAGLQFRLAWAVATHCIQVHVRLHQIVGQDRGIGFVCGDGGHDKSEASEWAVRVGEHLAVESHH